MMKEAEAHAEEDRVRREEAEVRNNADSLVFQTEKLLKDQADKVQPDDKEKMDAALKELKDALAGTDIEAVKRGHESLVSASQEFAQRLYANAQQEQNAADACRRRCDRGRRRRGRRRRDRRRRARRAERVNEQSYEPAADAAEAPASAAEAEADAAAPLEADFSRLESDRNELMDTLRRVQADFENYRKRVLREQTALVERATERLVEDLLPVLDSFDGALGSLAAADSPETAKVRDGVVGIRTQFASVLDRAGLEPIDAAGAVFDPNEHEAVMQDDGAANRTSPRSCAPGTGSRAGSCVPRWCASPAPAERVGD